MGSKGRVPPHMRMPLSGPGMFSPEPFGSGGHPLHGALPHDVMPPREIIEQKLAVQHNEMQNLAMENQRLAATHSALRHELAASQHEFQRLQGHMSGSRFEHEQKMMSIFDKIGKMEAELKASEPLKLELQQAQSEAQNLAASRHELIAKVQELNQDLQKNHGEAHQIPSLIAELDALRQEYEHCRSTYDYERKLRIDHYESLQVMEKNYVSMLGEVEKLQKELVNSSHADKSGGPYGSNMGYKENDANGQHSIGKNAYEDGYRAPQAQGHTGPASGGAQFGGAPVRAAQVPSRTGYEAARNNTYEAAPRSTVYDTSGAPQYETSRGSSYEPPRGSTYDAPRDSGPGYEAHGVTGAAQGATATANPVPHMMANVPPSYGSSAQVPPSYGSSGQVPQSYGSSAQGQAPYGSSAQGQASYGSTAQGPTSYSSSAQGPAYYGSAQGPTSYGASAQGPAAYGSSAQGPAAYGSSAQGPAAYGSSAQGPAAYGSSAQGPAAYGSSAQGPAVYGSSEQGHAPYGAPHMQGHYGAPQNSTRAGPGYEAPARGAPATGGAGANQRHR